jgi:hypothetical protein
MGAKKMLEFLACRSHQHQQLAYYSLPHALVSHFSPFGPIIFKKNGFKKKAGDFTIA